MLFEQCAVAVAVVKIGRDGGKGGKKVDPHV